ncbi:UvrD-helicase domain-containing protein [Thiobacillus sp.]|uniref:UvrD-helicase domain-containing protein n=1 Tax=Thiobacillus sp. TaxID=924 RepID=UPI0018290362|nr:UvrD-helicase domain-containing protein [Thiobacillus sp.]MBC2729642.1 UvrD-helicase domain-containing protein [Thiobacillus sp.]MBC2738377.1 UvrD-helicase domain-containing protein [Thiobacillus sp.]MBC2761343.1 UvrD-helicase domain-containing protein [Thiobacillus sp.]
MSLLAALNSPQREAAKYLDGPLLVLAGAGSGKTRVITHKIAYLIGECGYKPGSIAAITFTNKAAREMAERAAKLTQGDAFSKISTKGLIVTTFHSMGLRMLREDAKFAELKPAFSILDSADAAGIVSEILKTTDKQEIRRAVSRISLWKNELKSPAAALATAEDDNARAYAKIYDRYDATLRAYQAVDFDDLIRLPAELLDTHAELREKWQNRLRHILVDEYQDTNVAQYRLLQKLTGVRAAFTAVGDDDQAIYGWRGASADNLRQLNEDYPHLHVVKLEQNYRSSVRILKAANSLIANNPKLFEKRLWSDLGLGDAIQVMPTKDDEHEAESVVMRLLSHKFQHRTEWRDYAILYRGNYQARIFEQALRNEKVPYQLSGGQSFFDRAEIKDVIAYLRLIANSDDDPAFIRAVTTPKRGIGAATLEKLGQVAATLHVSLFEAVFSAAAASQIGERQLAPLVEFCNFINRMEERVPREPAGELLNDLLKTIEYEIYLFDQDDQRAAQSKWNNVLEFAAWIGKKGEEDEKDLLQLTQTIALITLLEGREEEEPDAVRLSTLHAAKGLEFGHVFLVGVEENILPHRDAVDEGRLEEERRLMYVGVTRAKKSLTLSYCSRRKRARETVACDPSRFIDELGDDVRQPEKPSSADAKASGSDRLAALKAMLG